VCWQQHEKSPFPAHLLRYALPGLGQLLYLD
jgi:hypothetical protein